MSACLCVSSSFIFFCCCCDSDCAFFVSLKNELYGCISLCNSHYIQKVFLNWIELNIRPRSLIRPWSQIPPQLFSPAIRIHFFTCPASWDLNLNWIGSGSIFRIRIHTIKNLKRDLTAKQKFTVLIQISSCDIIFV